MTGSERRRRTRGLGKRASLVTWSIRLVLWTLGFTRIIRTRIVGAEVVPDNGAVILAANHTSMIDVLFILAALRRQAIAMAMAEPWKSPLTRWLVEVLGQIPVVRGDAESGKQAMETAADALADGARSAYSRTRNACCPARSPRTVPVLLSCPSARVCRSSR